MKLATGKLRACRAMVLPASIAASVFCRRRYAKAMTCLAQPSPSRRWTPALLRWARKRIHAHVGAAPVLAPSWVSHFHLHFHFVRAPDTNRAVAARGNLLEAGRPANQRRRFAATSDGLPPALMRHAPAIVPRIRTWRIDVATTTRVARDIARTPAGLRYRVPLATCRLVPSAAALTPARAPAVRRYSPDTRLGAMSLPELAASAATTGWAARTTGKSAAAVAGQPAAAALASATSGSLASSALAASASAAPRSLASARSVALASAAHTRRHFARSHSGLLTMKRSAARIHTSTDRISRAARATSAANDAPAHAPTRPIALTWRMTPDNSASASAGWGADSLPSQGHSSRMKLPHTAPAPITHRELGTVVRANALDPALVDRVADDVMRRMDRRLRIERERRGIA